MRNQKQKQKKKAEEAHATSNLAPQNGRNVVNHQKKKHKIIIQINTKPKEKKEISMRLRRQLHFSMIY